MQTLLSESVQEIDFTDGFPVNKAALETILNSHEDGETIGTFHYSSSSGVTQIENRWFTQEEKDAFSQAVMKLDTPITPDRVTMDILLQYGTPAVSGEVDCKTAVDAILTILKEKYFD